MNMNEMLKETENEVARIARKFTGAKIEQANGGPTGEVVGILPDGFTLIVRTNGVERKAPYGIVEQYERDGKIRIVK